MKIYGYQSQYNRIVEGRKTVVAYHRARLHIALGTLVLVKAEPRASLTQLGEGSKPRS